MNTPEEAVDNLVELGLSPKQAKKALDAVQVASKIIQEVGLVIAILRKEDMADFLNDIDRQN